MTYGWLIFVMVDNGVEMVTNSDFNVENLCDYLVLECTGYEWICSNHMILCSDNEW